MVPVFLGGGLGAMLRFFISLVVVNKWNSFLPIATLGANLLAVLVMGISLFYAESKFETYPWLRAFILIGFCGGLSTFSTFSYETVLLFKGYHWVYALTNVIVSVALGALILFPFLRNIE